MSAAGEAAAAAAAASKDALRVSRKMPRIPARAHERTSAARNL